MGDYSNILTISHSLMVIMTSVSASVSLTPVEIQLLTIYMELGKILADRCAVVILNALDSLSQFMGIACIGQQMTFRKVAGHRGAEHVAGLIKHSWIQGLTATASSAAAAERIKGKAQWNFMSHNCYVCKFWFLFGPCNKIIMNWESCFIYLYVSHYTLETWTLAQRRWFHIIYTKLSQLRGCFELFLF